MKVLYIILGDLGNTASGSGLRPNCMYHAFQERGYTVYTLSGFQGKTEAKLREAEVKKAIRWVEENHPNFCYIESSTYPILHSCDYTMIRYLHKKKIPSAYFYRDFYRNFPDLFPRRSGLLNRVKELYLDMMQKKTDRILEKVDVVYFPSKQCFPYFHYARMLTLPPAGQVDFLPKHPKSNTCIYVGGVSEFYGFPMMMEAFEMLNTGAERYRLILVCREAEFKKVVGDKQIPEWLEVHHASGDALKPLYAKADVGLLTLTQNAYSNLAIGTKLFQYLSFGLPVLSTDVAAMRDIIEKNRFGTVAPYDAKAYAEAIRNMLTNEETIDLYRQSIEQNMTQKNLWVHRVDQIVNDLVANDTKPKTVT